MDNLVQPLVEGLQKINESEKNASDSSKLRGLSAALAKNDASEQSTVSSRAIDADFDGF